MLKLLNKNALKRKLLTKVLPTSTTLVKITTKVFTRVINHINSSTEIIFSHVLYSILFSILIDGTK